MTDRSFRSVLRTGALLIVATLALSGCGLVSRVVSTGGDPTPGTEPVTVSCTLLRLEPGANGAATPEDLAATHTVILSRLFSLGAPSATMTLVPPDQLVLGLPAGDDAAWRAAAVRPGTVAFIPVPAAFDQQVMEGQPLPATMDTTPVLTQADIAFAGLTEDELGKPAVSLEFTPDGAVAFDAWAAGNVGRRFAIVVDGIVASAPVIREAHFDGKAQISGQFTEADVASLVAVLESGPLPVAVTEVSTSGPEADGSCAAVGIIQ